ncbi:hypothetical protein J3R82DRAFT_3272 [Butyriboletus roseoflavus]|nr:hypothetical protein J3R82DRAFT_3272 [Butyriboletus roseoflavus]
MPDLTARVGVIDEYAFWVVGESATLDLPLPVVEPFLARVMGIFARARFCNFHGQPGARLEADQSVYAVGENGDGNSVLFASLDMFLFHTPFSHIRELNDIWVDKTINYARWVDFSNKLNNEWAGFTVYSTVMLAVDVSFLAMPGINGGTGSPSVATVALYMSLLSVVGSLLSSLLLARQRRAQDDSTTGATSFMINMTQWGGFKALGVMYSLPFALLIWAYVLAVILCELT